MVVVSDCRCSWLVLWWLWAGVGGWFSWWGRLFRDITPSPTGIFWCPRSAAWMVASPGSGAIRVGLVEVVDEGWVQNVIFVYPRPLLGTVPLPVYEVLKPAAPPPGVEDFFDCVDGFVGSDLGRRGGGISCSVDGGRKGLVKDLSKDVKGGWDPELIRQVELVSDIVDASRYPKRTYVPGTQLLAGQSETNVPGG